MLLHLVSIFAPNYGHMEDMLLSCSVTVIYQMSGLKHIFGRFGGGVPTRPFSTCPVQTGQNYCGWDRAYFPEAKLFKLIVYLIHYTEY